MAAATRHSQCARHLIRMNNEQPTPRSAWRDFLNRREPSALRVLCLLVLLAAGLLCWCIVWDFPVRGLVSLLLTLAIIALNPFWSLPSAPAYSDPKWELPAIARRRTWLLAALVTILAIWPRSICMTHSLTNEEALLIGSATVIQGHGETRIVPPTEFEIPAGYGDPAPSGDGWWARIEPRIGYLLDAAIRKSTYKEAAFEGPGHLLPWISGVLTTGLLVLLGAALGSLRAGLAAGLILAMHPQHVHWSATVGGASTMLFCLTAALLCLLKALRTNQWCWWLAIAVAQTVARLSHQAALPAIAALNLLSAGVILYSPAPWRDRRSHLLRLCLTLVMTAVPLTLLYSFTLWPQPAANLESLWKMVVGGDATGVTYPAWWRDIVSWGLLPLGCAAGVFLMLRQDWRTKLTAAALLAAIGVAFAVSGEGAAMLAVILLPLTLGWAGNGISSAFPRNRRMVHAPLILAAVFVMATAPVLQRTMALPRQPVRDAFKAANAADNALTFTFGGDAVAANVYGGGNSKASLSDLSHYVDIAFEKDHPLFVYHSIRDGKDHRNAEIIQELETSGRFHLIQEFPAFDPARSYRLYKYQPREQIIRLNVKPEKE